MNEGGCCSLTVAALVYSSSFIQDSKEILRWTREVQLFFTNYVVERDRTLRKDTNRPVELEVDRFVLRVGIMTKAYITLDLSPPKLFVGVAVYIFRV